MDRLIKTVSISLRIVLTLLAFGLAALLLNRYEYFSEIAAVDNIVGMVPIVLMLVAAGGITALLWMKHKKRYIFVTVTLAAAAVLSFALYPVALRGSWWPFMQEASTEADSPDMTLYEPFKEGSLAAKLDGPSSLTLSSNLPIIDGSTALYPLYAAFAGSVYDEAAYTKDTVRCTKTTGAYASLIRGDCDVILTPMASQKQSDAAKEAGVELTYTPVAMEAFVFLAGKSNPVSSLSVQQVRNIYSGKTARWGTLGWQEGGNIIAFQRPEGSGSQTALQDIMADLPIQSPQPLPDASLVGTNSLLKQVSVWWKGVQPALGYSYKYYATSMYPNPDSKLLSINGIPPTDENIQTKLYPFTYEFFAVTRGTPTGNTKAFIDWMLSPQGRELVTKTGYTPLSVHS